MKHVDEGWCDVAVGKLIQVDFFDSFELRMRSCLICLNEAYIILYH